MVSRTSQRSQTAFSASTSPPSLKSRRSPRGPSRMVGGPGQSELCELSRLETRAARGAGVQALDLAAALVVFHSAAGDTEGVDQVFRGQVQDPAGGGRGAVDAEHLGAVPADGDHRGGGRAEQAHHLDPGYHRGDQVRPGGMGALGEGERRGDDGGIGVPGRRVGVVVLGAVAERAVNPGGLRDRRAPPECARADSALPGSLSASRVPDELPSGAGLVRGRWRARQGPVISARRRLR